MENIPPRRRLLSVIFISPDEPRLRAGWRLLVHFVLMLVILSLGTLAATPVLSAAPHLTFEIGQAIALVAITLATFVARRRLDQRSIASLGLTWNRRAALDLAFGILLPGVQMGLIFAVEAGLGWLRLDNPDPTGIEASLILRELAILFLAFVVVGWQEELLTRGYWLQNLEDGLRLPGALVVSSILFALAHLANPNVSWMAVVGLTAAGLFLAYAYLATRQLWLPIGLHIGWNFFEGPIFGFPVSGTTHSFTLLETIRSGPELLTGGAFGPEAGLIQFPVLLLAVGAIYLYTRRHRARPS